MSAELSKWAVNVGDCAATMYIREVERLQQSVHLFVCGCV